MGTRVAEEGSTLFSQNGLYVGGTSVLLSSAGPQEPLAVEPGMNELQPLARAT